MRQTGNGHAMEEVPGRESQGGLPILLRSRRLLIAGAVAGLILGGVVAALRPNEYTSAGKILVRVGEREQATLDSAFEDRRPGPRAGYDDLQNEIQLMSNPLLFERLVDRLGADTVLRPYDPAAADGPDTGLHVRWLHRFQSWWGRRSAPDHPKNCGDPKSCERCRRAAVLRLKEVTVIGPEAYSSVITVSSKAHDPELARLIVDGLVTACLDRHMEVFDTDPSHEFVRQEVEAAVAEASRLETTLAEYRAKCQVFDLPGQSEELQKRIASLEEEVGKDSERLVELQARGELLRDLYEKEPKVVKQLGSSQQVNPYHTQLQDRVTKLQAERVELLTKLKPDSDAIKVKDKAILLAQEELRKMPVWVHLEGVERDVPNTFHDTYRHKLDEVKLERQGLEPAAAERVRRLGSLRAEFLHLQQCEPELRQREREATKQRGTVAQLYSVLERSRVTNAMDRKKLPNFRVIQAATLPWVKTGPKRPQLAVLGMLFGLMAAFSLVLLRQVISRHHGFRRPVERDDDEIDLDLVEIVPESRAPRVAHFEKRRAR
jgi:uncharacterized protein involved in exopolysaccharide biosynthesis